jgi:hypothetical protein
LYDMTSGLISSWSYLFFKVVIEFWDIPWDNHGRTDGGAVQSLLHFKVLCKTAPRAWWQSLTRGLHAQRGSPFSKEHHTNLFG